MSHRRAASAMLLASLLLTGCIMTPPPAPTPTPSAVPDEAISLSLADVTVTATVTGGGTESANDSLLDCAVADATWDWPEGRTSFAFALTDAATACPDEEAMNGRFPTWASAADLPEGATAIEMPGVDEAYRFSLVYDEYTNSHDSWQRELAMLVLDDRAIVIASLDISPEEFDAMLATVRVET